MNILLNINDIYIENIFLMDKVRNTVLENSDFTKIIYSNEFIGLNGIYLKIIFINFKIENFNNKTKYNLNNESNNIISSSRKLYFITLKSNTTFGLKKYDFILAFLINSSDILNV